MGLVYNTKNGTYEYELANKVLQKPTDIPKKKSKKNNAKVPSSKKQENINYFDDGYDFGDVTRTGIQLGKNLVKTPENFKDGYQRGDVLKTIGASALDVGAGTVKGIMNFGESAIADPLQYGVAQVSDWMGFDKFANAVRENAKQNGVEQTFAPIDKLTDRYTAIGTTGDQLSSGIGNIIAMANGSGLLKAKGLPSSVNVGKFAMPVTSIASGIGSGMTEAYNNKGTTDGEAWAYGMLSGFAEGFSESLFGGLGERFNLNVGEGGLDDFLIKRFTDKISNKTLRILAESGLKATGEGVEEILSGVGSAISKKLTYLSEEDLKTLIKDENLTEQFIMGTLTSLISQTPGTIQSVKTGTDLITGQPTNNQAITPENMQENVPYTVKNNKGNAIAPLGNNALNTPVLSQNNQPYNVLNDGKEYAPYVPINNTFRYKKSTNPKINALNESMVKNNFDNSIESKSLSEVASVIIKDKGWNVLFDNTITNKSGKPVNALVSTENGGITIRLNPNSTRAAEFLLMHEVTHAIETDSIKKLVTDYASKNTEFNQVLENLKQTYETDDVSDEVLADISGQLFGNQEFINSLIQDGSIQNKNIITKIYDAIKRLLNSLTEKGRQKNAYYDFVSELEQKWRKAYKEATTESAIKNIKNTKFAIKNTPIGKYVKADRQVITGNNHLKWEKQVENYINDCIRKNKDVNVFTGDGEILTITKNTSGKAKFRNYYTDSNGKKHYMTNDEFYTKLLAEVHIDELGQISKKINKKPVPDKKNHPFAKDGFYYHTAFFEDFNGDYYKITMSIGKNGNIKTIYNVGKLEQRKRPVISGSSVNNGANGSLTMNNIPQSNKTVKSSISTKYSMQELKNNSSNNNNLKQQQLDIILNNNPAEDNYHTWIRNIDDIKTFEESLQDNDYAGWETDGFIPDYDANIVKQALKTGKITVYSSYPIEQGIFVTPSKMEAESYSGNGKVYSKEVDLQDVAWIDPTQGQYAKVDMSNTKFSIDEIKDNQIQGLEDYTKPQIKNITTNYIKNALEYANVQADIVGMEIIGSRNRGTAKSNSDLDIVVELKGDNLREDDLFNLLNDTDEPLEINGIKVDINPIIAEKSGTLKEFMERSNKYDKEHTRYSINEEKNDYELWQDELNETLEKAKSVDENFYNDMKQQLNEYRDRHRLEYRIYEETRSRQVGSEVNNDFFKEHFSDYDGQSGTKHADGIMTSMKLKKGNNLAKLSFTEGEDVIWIDELYVKNKNQGYGTEIVEAIKKYANENGKYVKAYKELSTAKRFWDKTLRSDKNKNNDTKYSLNKDNKGRTLTKEQQEYFKDSKVRDENGSLIEVYHRTYKGGFTKFNGEVNFFTNDPNADFYGDDKYKVYLNIKNPLIIEGNGKNYNSLEFNEDGVKQYKTTTIENAINNMDKITKSDVVAIAKAIDSNNSLEDYIDEFNSPKEALDSVVDAYTEGGTLEDFVKQYGSLNIYIDNGKIKTKNVTTTRDITEYAKKKGYDGVIFKNIQDKTNGAADVYATLESPNQIKNVDNTNPTDNPDIRYSQENKTWKEHLEENYEATGTRTYMPDHTTDDVSENSMIEWSKDSKIRDNKGRTLSDEIIQKTKNSKARDEKGNLLSLYHGSPNTDITEFDINKSGQNTMSAEYGIYFTDSEKSADDFSYERIETDSMFFDKKGKKGKVYEAYLNLEKPLDFRKLSKKEISDLYEYASHLGQLDGKETFIENMTKWQQIGNHQLMKGNLDLKKLSNKYDGFIAKMDVKNNELEYVVFDPKQVFFADKSNESIKTNNIDNKGYHWGDLGKGRDTYHWNMTSSRRSTGHFGTGTYFLGSKDGNVGSIKNGRQLHEVDFSKYNLFKPKNENEAYTLHEGLKALNYINNFNSDDFESLQLMLEKHGITGQKSYEAFVKARELYFSDEYQNASYDSELDSISTYFMKELGFNGIDVRGIEGFDNGTYGSVIYDLDNTVEENNLLINTPKQDNKGRKLTKEQQNYFKNVSNELKDEKGNLKTLYHGSRNDFTIFDLEKSGESNKNARVGFWFTESKEGAENFANSIWYGENEKANAYEVYLNIKNPKVYEKNDYTERKEKLNSQLNELNERKKVFDEKYHISSFITSYEGEDFLRVVGMMTSPYSTYTDEEYKQYIKGMVDKGTDVEQYFNEVKEYSKIKQETKKLEKELSGLRYNDPYEQFRTDIYKIVGKDAEDANIGGSGMALNDEKGTLEAFRNSLIEQGYDGIVIKNTVYDSKTMGGENNQYVAFYPNQIKNVDNLNPTDSDDIRYSMIEDPIEISKLKKEDASTTPKAPYVKISDNAKRDGNSKHYSNLTEKSKFLNDKSVNAISNETGVKYYDTMTNQEVLKQAKKELDNGGSKETLKWFAKEPTNATPSDIAKGWILLKQYQDKGDYDSVVQVAKKMRLMGTTTGRTLQMYAIMERLTPQGMVKYAQAELSEAFEEMVKNKSKAWIDKYKSDFELTPSETKFIMDTMLEVSKMKDGYEKNVKLAEIQKLMTDKLPPEKGAGIKAWMRISMLFNPKTQVRNVLGNTVIAPVNAVSDVFASGIDKMVSKKTGVRTTGTINLNSYTSGFKQGLYESYNDFKKGINTRNVEGNRFEIGEGKSFNDKTLIGHKLNQVDNLLSFMLDAGDRGFYEAAFTNSINNQMILNNTKTVTPEMIDIATTEALQRTWQDNNEYTRFVLNTRKGLNKLMSIGNYGLGDILIPFAKTPANLTKAIVDYSPVGLVHSLVEGHNLKNAIETGQFTAQQQHKFVQDLGKAVAGTMLYVIGYALANAGAISGKNDEDKDTANFMKNTLGISPYSIKIGNKTFTYDWAQPVAAPFAIMSDFMSSNDEDASILEKSISAFNTGFNIVVEQSFMQSIKTVLDNKDGIATGIQEAIMELPSRAIPTLSKQIVDLTDGTQRQTFVYGKPLETAKNKVLAKIPGTSKALAPTVDTMGREIKKYGGKNNIFNVFFNPANVNNENISKSAGEIYRLYQETGRTDLMPRVSPYYINHKGEKIVLSNEDKSRFQKISGDIIEQNVQKIMKSSQYQYLSDEEKADIIQDIVSYSYNKARFDVLGIEMSDTYQSVADYEDIGGNLSDYYLFQSSINNENSETKKQSISNFLIESDLSDKEISYLYNKYYSSDKTMNMLSNFKIPIKEYIKLNLQYFESDYNQNGKAISGSKQAKIFNYINSLKLNATQKAILMKMQYKSFKKYDKQILNYINNMNATRFEKASYAKQIGFDYYDDYLINYILKQNTSNEEKINQLKNLGFRYINGKIYK